MTIRSMTGFAREAGATGPHLWAFEIKTVNGRGLDIRLRTPQGFEGAGEEARRLVAAALTRGQCQLTLTLAKSGTETGIRINRPLLERLLATVGEIERPAGIGPATLDGLLALRGVIETEEEGSGAAFDEALKADLAAAAARLVAALQAMREAEGRALAAVLDGQLAAIASLVAAAEACPGRSVEAVKVRLAEQVAALLGASPALDPNRLHQEAALLAARGDIREELDRLVAHVDSAKALLTSGGAVGRRLDFLAQELGREANTLCSKANDIALSRIGLDLKAVVEQFREQVQNVE
jgi:uncharacterized protein (TIGR00255 family)